MRNSRGAISGTAWSGFDLAGAEIGHPPSEHAGAIGIARDGGVPLTLHAGEADAAPRVIEAARLGAQRIGHGVRLADALGPAGDAALIDEARAAQPAPGAVPDQQRAHRRRGVDRQPSDHRAASRWPLASRSTPTTA